MRKKNGESCKAEAENTRNQDGKEMCKASREKNITKQ